MCRIKMLLSILIIGLFAVEAWAATPITVVNPSFEIPQDGRKRDINLDTPGVVTGWARVGLTTSAGREYGWQPTDGTATAFMGKDALIFNLTDFLIQTGDEFQLTFNAKSTWAANVMRAQLYYYDAGNRVVVATTDANLTILPSWPNNSGTSWGTYYVNFRAADVPASADHKLGIQLQHIKTRGSPTGDANNIWAGLDYIRLDLMTPLLRAQNPSPAHESLIQNTDVILSWSPGPDAPAGVSYRVYLSSSFNEVNSAASAALKGSTSTASLPISGLNKGTTYYWRVDTVDGANIYRGNIWKFTIISVIAYNPEPPTGTKNVSLDMMLGWKAGSGAVLGHVVLLGDKFTDVNNAPVDISGAAPFRVFITNPADVNWAPSESGITLATSKTYYWRIDEVQSLSTKTIHKGEVWSFTTVPIKGLGSIMRQLYENITGNTVANLTGDPNFPDNPTETDYLSSFEAPHMAIVNYGSRVHGYLYVRKPGIYTFWIASGENSQLWLGSNISNASIIAFVDSANGREGWTNPRQWDRYPEIQQSAPIYLEGNGTLYYIMVLHKKAWGADNLSVAWSGPDSNGVQEVIPGTSLIPFDQVKLLEAYSPQPANNAKDVEREPVLSWVSGEYAAKHDVYFGTSFNDVNNASRTNDPHHVLVNQNQLANTYNPGTLNFETTYYWRIDEVNDAHPDKMWKGSTWSFTVGSYLIVDDFEDYNNYTPDRVFQTWLDGIGYSAEIPYFPTGYPGNGTGAAVGHDIWSTGTPYTTIIETSILHGGGQSMPVDYNNAISPYYSETTRIFATSQNWTTLGIKALTLWFRGIPASVGSLTYDQATGTYTMTGSGADIWNTADQFHFAYKTLTGDGTIIARIDSITNTNSWAKAGVMIRETLDPGSPSIDAVVSADNRVAMQWRATQGADMGSPDSSTNTVAGAFTLPHWVKLTRSGFVFTVQHSADGVTWQDIVPETEGDPLSMSLTMGTTVFIGLAVTSHNTSATCEAVFSNVSITTPSGSSYSPAGPFTVSQDIGIASNDAAPMYVTLEDDTGGKKTLNHPDDPNAVLQGTWQEWNIALSAFTGVKLDKIKKMTIGTGNKTAGGSGSLYFDDIRLYRSRCVPSMTKPAADVTDDCIVNYSDLDAMIAQWLSTATALTVDLNTDNSVDLKDFAVLAQGWLEEILWP